MAIRVYSKGDIIELRPGRSWFVWPTACDKSPYGEVEERLELPDGTLAVLITDVTSGGAMWASDDYCKDVHIITSGGHWITGGDVDVWRSCWVLRAPGSDPG